MHRLSFRCFSPSGRAGGFVNGSPRTMALSLGPGHARKSSAPSRGALARGVLSRSERRRVFERFNALAASWDEVTDVLAVRSLADLLLARHSLRAADAGQLGAALLIQNQFGGALPFVCLDERLSAAAELEGLQVLP